ncbi:MAG: tetratricopeptide repeat protein [Candidatus Hodarchaeales archaeon]
MQYEEKFKNVDELLLLGNYEEARKILHQIIAVSDKNDREYIRARIYLSRLALKIDQYDFAMKVLNETLPLAENNGYTEGVADCKLNIAFLHLINGEFEPSYGLIEEALSLWKKTGEEKGIAKALFRKGQYFELSDDFEQALQCYEESLVLREKIEDYEGISNSCSQIAWIMVNTKGNIEEGKKYLEKSQEAAEKTGNKLSLAGVLHTKAGILIQEARYNEAIIEYENCLSLYQQMNSTSGIATVKNNMALVYKTIGNFEASLTTYDEVKELFKSINDDTGLAVVLQNMAILKSSLGYFDESISLINSSLEIYKKINSLIGMAIIYGDLAEVYHNSGNTLKAYESFIASMDYYSKVDSHEEYVDKLCSFSDFLVDIGDIKKSSEYLSKAREVASSHESSPELLRVKLSQAKQEAAQDNISESTALFNECYVTAKKHGNFSIMIQSSMNLAKLALIRYRTGEKEKDYEESMTLVTRSSEIALKAHLYPVYVNTLLIKASLYASKLNFRNALNILSIAMVTAEKKKLYVFRPRVREIYKQMQNRQSMIKALSKQEFTDEVMKEALERMKKIESISRK